MITGAFSDSSTTNRMSNERGERGERGTTPCVVDNQLFSQVLVRTLSASFEWVLDRLKATRAFAVTSSVITYYNVRPEIVHFLLLAGWALICTFFLSIVPFLISTLSPLLCISGCYYWLALLTRRSLNSTYLYLILWASLFGELLNNCVTKSTIASLILFSSSSSLDDTPDDVIGFYLFQLRSLLISGTILVIAVSAFGLPHKLACGVIAVCLLVRVLSISTLSLANSSLRPYLAIACGLLGIIVARCTESTLCPPISTLITPDGRVVAWRRRRSSNIALTVTASSSKLRRTSLPTLGGNRTSSFHGNHVSY